MWIKKVFTWRGYDFLIAFQCNTTSLESDIFIIVGEYLIDSYLRLAEQIHNDEF